MKNWFSWKVWRCVNSCGEPTRGAIFEITCSEFFHVSEFSHWINLSPNEKRICACCVWYFCAKLAASHLLGREAAAESGLTSQNESDPTDSNAQDAFLCLVFIAVKSLRMRKGRVTPSAFAFAARQRYWFALVNSYVVATPDAFFTLFCQIAKMRRSAAPRCVWPVGMFLVLRFSEIALLLFVLFWKKIPRQALRTGTCGEWQKRCQGVWPDSTTRIHWEFAECIIFCPCLFCGWVFSRFYGKFKLFGGFMSLCGYMVGHFPTLQYNEQCLHYPVVSCRFEELAGHQHLWCCSHWTKHFGQELRQGGNRDELASSRGVFPCITKSLPIHPGSFFLWTWETPGLQQC